MSELSQRLPRLRRPSWNKPVTPGAAEARSHEAADHPLPQSEMCGVAWARSYRNKLRITDGAVIAVAILAALSGGLSLSSGSDATPTPTGNWAIFHWTIAGVVLLWWLALLSAFHSRDSRVLGLGATEYKRVITASTSTFGLLAIVLLVLNAPIVREYFVIAMPLGVIGLTVSRWTWRKWLTNQRLYGHYLSRAIVVGSRDDVEYVIDQIHGRPWAAYLVVGAAVNLKAADQRFVAKHVPVVSDLDNVAGAAAALGADTVIVAGQPTGGSRFIRDLGWNLEGTAAELVLASRLTNIAGPRIHFRPVEGLPLMHVELPQFEGGKHVLKRSLDILGSGFALVALMPLFLVIGFLIRRDSDGPVLFRQERVGRNGETFQMLKFRSMVPTAEDQLAELLARNESDGVLFKLKDDPRVTRIGRILRKYSLDELPQFWNVFTGQMSLVGPRPPLPREVVSYESHVHRRLYIKPGLTGMWQVNGRSDLSWDESVQLDLYYVENWSLTGDLMILWRTLRVLIQPAGAY